MIQLQRNNITIEAEKSHHAGFSLAYGLPRWNPDKTQRGDEFAKFIGGVCSTKVSDVYKSAYHRWESVTKSTKNVTTWYGDLESRLYIGTGNLNTVEANISIHHTYGTPLISGSAIKGLVRAYVNENISNDILDILFGKASEGAQQSTAGYLVFHDAWWVPNQDTPFVPEVITVHHPEYYQEKGQKPATDFDSPNPNAQICATGSFLFAIEGPPMWASWAMNVLTQALINEGIGAKTSSGYGYFRKPVSESLKTSNVIWEDANLRWNAGKSLLEAHSNSAGSKAILRISIAQLGSLFDSQITNKKLKALKRGEVKAKVIVEKKLNQYMIKEIINE